MKKICVKCGAPFESLPNQDRTLCDACTAKSLRYTALRDKICVDCGAAFTGYPRSQRCPSCRAERLRETSRRHRERRKAGTARKIGSTDICTVCGKPYIVASGLQRYCPECAPETVAEHVRARTREWARENIDYQQRQADRRNSVAEIPCIVCGKPFAPHNAAKTCSPECAAALRKQRAREYGIAHRAELEKANRERNRAKLAAMSPEELAAYRERTNAKARENYRKRKEREKSEKE